MPAPQSRTRIKNLLSLEKLPDTASDPLVVMGWVKTVRSSGAVSFVQINDGSTFADLQIVVDPSCPDHAIVGQLNTGSSVSVSGVPAGIPGPRPALRKSWPTASSSSAAPTPRNTPSRKNATP